jgi:hypothetical protein
MSRSGLSAQLGLKAETTWGTAVTVDTFVPMVSESMGVTPNRIESGATIAGRRVLDAGQWAEGSRTVGGDLGLELPTNSAIARLLLEQMFGTVTGAGPWTFTPGLLYGKSMTAQVGVPGVDGTVRAKTYNGCKVNTWEIAWSAGEIVTLGLGLIAQDETTATALATASYAAGSAVPFIATSVTATIGGSAVCVKQGTLSGDNKLERRFCGGSRLTTEPIESDRRDYTGSLVLEFTDLTQYNRFINGTTAAVVVTFATSTTTSLVLTYNCRFDGETPKVGGRGIIDQPLPIKAVGSTDAAAITAVFTA